jgi:hypothetical protein
METTLPLLNRLPQAIKAALWKIKRRDDVGKIVFAVSPDMQPQVEQICFSDCGKILTGILRIDNHLFLPCKTQNCSFEEKSMDANLKSSIDGSDIWFRRLKENKETP